MAVAPLSLTLRTYRPGPAALLLGSLALAIFLALLGHRLFAQVEGDRGILPVATSSDIQVDGIEVEATGSNATEARLAGWKQAQKLAWAKAGGAPMADGVIESMVAAVVIEREQIGPRRYIARLGVVFDRERAGRYLGGGGARSHSAPLLTIPVLHSGGVAQVYEVKGAWQKAWAEFRASGSSIDYVRPAGSGGESLLITAGQPGRRSRAWWRNVLDQFGAADVIVPVARLERQWPGGPVRGTFTARYGPDNTFLASFEMTANDEAGVPKMLAQAVQRIDAIYSQALQDGRLAPDQTLLGARGQIDAALADLIAQGRAADEAAKAAATGTNVKPSDNPSVAPTVAAATTVTIQFATPDAGAVDAALSAVRGSPGVQSASTTSLAMGGTSVMRVTYTGDPSALAAALRSRGWQVSGGGSSFSIKR
jgi:hypothetical protein